MVVVVSVLDEPLAPMELLLPVDEPEEPVAPMELPLVDGVAAEEPVEPDAPIDEVDGEVVDGEVDDEPLEAVSLLLGVELVLGLDEPEAPMVLLEPVVPEALEPAVSALVGAPATGAPLGAALGDGLVVDPALPPEAEPWATAMPLMARAAAAASVVSVFLVALMCLLLDEIVPAGEIRFENNRRFEAG